MNQSLKACLGLLITLIAVGLKSLAYVGSGFTFFNGSAVSIGLLALMALGLFMFAFYSMPNIFNEDSSETKITLDAAQD